MKCFLWEEQKFFDINKKEEIDNNPFKDALKNLKL